MQIVSRANRVSMSYSCELCCPNSFYQSRLSPQSLTVNSGPGAGVNGQEQDINCYQNVTPWYSYPEPASWASDDTGVATVSPMFLSYSTTVTGVSGGTTSVTATWSVQQWFFSGSIDDCVATEASSSVMVVCTPTVTSGCKDLWPTARRSKYVSFNPKTTYSVTQGENSAVILPKVGSDIINEIKIVVLQR